MKSTLGPTLYENLRNEINILTKISSLWVIKLFDIKCTKNNVYLIMEFCNGGDLGNLKGIRGKFSEVEARIMLQQLVAGFKEIYK
jgi:serine/threonine protein kinase